MKAQFDLVDEGWIPCVMLDSGDSRELSLRETLICAAEIREIGDPSPLVTVSLYRLLLAILHRNFGPASSGAWDEVWQRGSWDEVCLNAYLKQWRHRFDLFDEQHPFYQVPSLDFQYEKPIAILAHELASGNNTTLFDHTTEEGAPALTSAQAARYLVAYQSFAMGGLVSLEKGQDAKLFKSADAAPLVKGAVAVVQGDNLFQTLALNLHHYDGRRVPFEGTGADCPAWEREGETQAGDRWPAGYLDLLTWQSRRIRLRPERDDGGNIVVRHVVIMKGTQFPEGCTRHGRETMLAFGRNLKAKGVQDPYPVVGFMEDRATWRDSLTLFQSIHDQHERPMTLDWLNDLCQDRFLDRSRMLPLHLYGLCPDQANVLFWRRESLPLPLIYLEDRELRDKLRTALDMAERTGHDLSNAVWLLAKLLLAPESDDSNARQPLKQDVSALAESLTSTPLYWASLDAPFKRFLIDMAQEAVADTGTAEYGIAVDLAWRQSVKKAARDAFAEITRGLDMSARALKAVAASERRLRGLMQEHLGEATSQGGAA